MNFAQYCIILLSATKLHTKNVFILAGFLLELWSGVYCGICFLFVGLTVWVDIQVSSLPNIVNEEDKFHRALIIYPVSLLVTILIEILSKLCIFLVPIRANYRVHNKMVTCLLQAPSHFYAVNSAGRILNRFSQDINNLDDLLPFNLVYFFQCATPGLAAIVLCFLSSGYLIPVCFVVLGICFGTSKFFFSSAMDIKRLMSESGSPLYSHFSNTMEGVRIIRVHKRQQSFIESAYRY
jgi:ABC-type multidrug transport system fused ATPase/permease subunit